MFCVAFAENFLSFPESLLWKLDLAETDLAENLDLMDTLQEILATIFDF